MQVKTVLGELEPGSSVAEYDLALQRYFVETQTFRSLLSGNYDVIAGDKGTGKTALYRILKEQALDFAELAGIEIVLHSILPEHPYFNVSPKAGL